MTNKTEREAFEAWALKVGYEPHALERTLGGYKYSTVDDNWDGWQARAELSAAPSLAVWYGPMPESNGKTNWTAILHRGEVHKGITIDRSEYPDRVRYEADRVRWLIGELAEEPFILDYDADKHSGYVAPPAKLSTVSVDKPVDRLTPRVKAVLEAFMVTYRCKNWEGDWVYQEADALLAAGDSQGGAV